MNRSEIERIACVSTKLDMLVESLREIKNDDLNEIKNHLGRLNSQVAKNTAFRSRASLILGMIGAVSTIIIGTMVAIIFGKL